jgi:hypothetical protein
MRQLTISLDRLFDAKVSENATLRESTRNQYPSEKSHRFITE